MLSVQVMSTSPRWLNMIGANAGKLFNPSIQTGSRKLKSVTNLFLSGFESNNLTTEGFSALDNIPTIVTSPVKTGNYALEATPLQSVSHKFSSSGVGIIYAYTDLYVQSLPDLQCHIIVIVDALDTNEQLINIDLDATGKLVLLDGIGNPHGSSPVLSLSTWYKVNFTVNGTDASAITINASLNGIQFGSATYDNTVNGVGNNQLTDLWIGLDIVGGDVTLGKIDFDNIFINNLS